MIPGLITTIIPVRNRALRLRDAVASVLAQNHRPIEIIIVDDGSTDDTGGIADSFAASHPNEIRVVHQRNSGPGVAREAGRQLARGEFIQYLDSDDVLLPGKFESQLAGLRREPDCGVAYGFTRYRHSDGTIEPLPWKGSGKRLETMFPAFLESRPWDTPTPLYRASVCSAAGPWTDLRLEEDWEYDCRIAALGTKLQFSETYVAEVRDHDDGRLCRGGALDPLRLAARTKAHELIYQHAIRAGIAADAPEMQRFARELFLLTRQCGAAGLDFDSRKLFQLARKASGAIRGNGLDFRIYNVAAAILGWSLAGRLACMTDAIRGTPTFKVDLNVRPKR